MLVAYFGVRFGLIFQLKPGYFEITPNLYKLESCWAFIRSFFEIFGIQVYFLWILQTQKRQVLTQRKKTIILVPTTTILGAALIFVGIVYLSVKVNVDYSEKRVKDPLLVL
jgi:hypothetical protein